NIDLRLEVRHREMVVAFLDHFPEGQIRTVAMARQVGRRHAERIGLDLKLFLPAQERFAPQRIDLADLLVGHGVAAARRTVAMDHQERAMPVIGAVVGVREAGIDGEVIAGIGIHQTGGDRVKAFRRLTIAFLDLRPEIARPAADRIDLEQRIAPAGVLLPDFEFRFLLEDADEDRRLLRHVLGLELRQHLRRQFLHRLRGQLVAFVRKTSAERQRAGQNRQRHQRAPARRADPTGAVQCDTPRRMDHPHAITTTMVSPKGWLSQDRAALGRVALRVITNSKLSTNLPGEFNALATLSAPSRRTGPGGGGSIGAKSWRKRGDAAEAQDSVRPIAVNFSRRSRMMVARSSPRSSASAAAIASPVAAMAAAGSRCAPPIGSVTMVSMTPSRARSCAVIFIAAAASCARAVSRHRIEAAPSGEMTL